MIIDTTNMCSHLQRKRFEPDGVYYPIWQAMKDNETLTAVVRRRKAKLTAHLQEWEKNTHSGRQGTAEGNTRR